MKIHCIDDFNFNPVLSPSTEVAGCFSQLSSGHLSILLDHVQLCILSFQTSLLHVLCSYKF